MDDGLWPSALDIKTSEVSKASEVFCFRHDCIILMISMIPAD
jgi:hypothetical protein